jgi:pimeloyl-ACP methyl ester carboxylesterase
MLRLTPSAMPFILPEESFSFKGIRIIEKVINGIGCLLGQEGILPDRKTLVFVHGAGSSNRMWIPQIQSLAAKNNTVAMNLPGHGLGERKGETTIPAYASSVIDLVDELGLKKVVLAGLSMGGAITQECAWSYPDRFSAIILISTGARLKVLPQLFDIVQNHFNAYIDFLPQFAFAKATSQEIIAPILEEARKCPANVVYGDFQACVNFDFTARVKEINLPCLILSGSEDKLTPPKLQDYLHEQIAGSKLIRVQNAGHILNIEKPREVNEAIEEFIESLPLA